MINVFPQYYDIWGICPKSPIETFKWIERAARICYQSQDKITDNSWERMIDMLSKKGHWAMLEHSNIRTSFSYEQFSLAKSKFIKRSRHNGMYLYAGNLRAYMEAMGTDSPAQVYAMLQGKILRLNELQNWGHRYSVRFVTDRAVTHEFVRHRPCSFAQLSQRYVDHRKCMDFIEPTYLKGCDPMDPKYEFWFDAMESAAEFYKQMRESGRSPQEARKVLPNSTATEILVTADLEEWALIFDLRVSPAADPQICELLKPVRKEFIARGWLD